MAELTEDIAYQEGPGPAPKLSDQHRAKLDSIVSDMIRNKESDSNIQAVVNDFKSKYSAESSTQTQPPVKSTFNIDISQPTFKSTPANVPTREFRNEPQGHELDFIKKAHDAKDRLTAELHANDAQHEKNVREQRRDDFTVNNLRDEYQKKGITFPAEGLDLPEVQMALKEAKQREYNKPVTAEDIAANKQQTLSNPSQSAKFIKDLNKPEANKDAYRIAAFNDVANDPEGEKRIPRIEKNAEKIGKGEYTYDPQTGVFGKPEGFINSLFSGRTELNKSFDDYSYFKDKPDASVTDRLNTILKNSLDEPVSVPKNKFAEYGKMAAGQPVKGLLAGAIAGGAATYSGNPEAAPAAFQLASAGVSAIDMYKVGYRNALISNYAQFKQKGLSDQEALNKARPLAEDQANTDAATAAVMGIAAGKMAFTPSGITLNSLKKGLGSALTQIGEAGAKKALEGFGVGAIGGVGQIIKNVQATQAGLPTDLTTGVKDQIESGVILTAATHVLAKAPELLKPANIAKIVTPLAKMPAEVVENNLNMQEKEGHITPEQSQRVKEILNEQRILESSIPDNLPETDRLKIGAKIKERSALKQKLENVDEAYHPEIKEDIKKLNEDILSISKGSERGELQKLVNKEINKDNVHGFAIDVLKNATEKELESHMKDIAEQAHDPNSAKTTIDTFGEEIVNKAKELYPSEPIDAGKVPDEKIGAVEVSEHGEDTKTAAGQENGIKPSQLSEDGVKEAKELGKYLVDNGKNRIVTSEVERAGETAEVAAKEVKDISGKDIPVEKNKILNTWDIGEYDGKPEGSFDEAEWTSKPNEAPRGGESFNDFSKRMEQANEYIKSLPEDTHVVTHSKVMRALEALKQTDGKWTDETTQLFLNNKELTNAVQEPSTSSVLQHTQEGIGGERSERGGMEPSQQGEGAAGTRPEEESKGTSEEKVERPMAGITHRQMDAMAEEFGLPTYEKSPEKVAEWDEQAAKQLRKPEALNELFTKLRNGIPPDAVETRMMLQYMGDLLAKIDKDPYNRQLQDQLIRTKDLFNIGGRIQGKGLVARKGSIPVEETLGDFIIKDREVNKAPLTDEQISVSKKEYEEIKAAKEAYEKKLQEQKEKNVKEKAQKIVEQKNKESKKQIGKDYISERKQILKDIGEKWKKSSKGNLGISFVPYAKELAAIAPDVMKLVKNIVEEGIEKLPDVIKAVHNQVKEFIPQITEKDVHDIIAGEYTKKQSRSELAQQLYDLRKEAKLMNELDQLIKGEVPADEKKIRRRNQRIEELKSQIKELKDEIGLNERTDEERLTSLKGRYKSQIKYIEEKIAKGDYGPDEKPESIKLDKEATELKDRLIKLKKDREIRLAQQEYESRTKLQKAKDLASESLDVVRTFQTNPDMSFFGRQGIKYIVTHPVQGAKLFWESAKQAVSQKKYDRWLYDLHNSPAWKLIEDSGLAVLDPNTLHASQREEQWRSQLIHKIPIAGQVAKASERAFTSAANMARVDWFMEGVNILREQGKTFENSPEEYKGWASAVNNMTGRGGLGAFEPVAGQLAIPFWSPRLIASNLNLLNPYYYYKLPKTARIMAIKNMAQYMVTGVAFLGLARMMGADVETDPRSSDFGKLKVGNTRYDIWGGGAQYIRAFAQILTATRKSNGGMQKLDAKNQTVVGANLVRSKLSPLVGFGVDVTLGKNIVGEEVHLKDAWKLTVPMLLNDINDARKDSGPEGAAVSGVLSFLGIGAQTYDSKSGGSGGGAGASGHFGKPAGKKHGKHSKH